MSKANSVQSRFQKHAASSMQCVEMIFLEMLRAVHNVTDDEESLIKQIGQRLGDDIAVLTQELIPDLRRYFPSHETPKKLDTKQYRIKLREAVSKWVSFVVEYLSKKCLILFIDDMQWGDDNSIQMLREFFHLADTPIFFFFAARYNEAKNSSASSFISNISTSSSIRKIFLNPLNVYDVSKIIGEMLSSDPTDIKDLSELVFLKTKGNPYFVTQVRTLYLREVVKLTQVTT